MVLYIYVHSSYYWDTKGSLKDQDEWSNTHHAAYYVCISEILRRSFAFLQGSRLLCSPHASGRSIASDHVSLSLELYALT